MSDLLGRLGDSNGRFLRSPVNHAQVPVAVGSWHAAVDVDVAPLIKALWLRGIRTLFSCQEATPWGSAWSVDPDHPRVSVTFPTTDDLLRLLRLLPRRSDIYRSAIAWPTQRWEYKIYVTSDSRAG